MNYSEVVAAALAYSDRSDTAVTNSMASFIAMTEARVNRLLRNEEMSITLDIPTVADQAAYALPSDFAGARSVSLETDGAITPLTYVNPELIDALVDDEGQEDLQFYTLRNKEIVVMKPPSDNLSNIRITYFKKVPNLNSVDDTNWLADLNPDVYVNGILFEISCFIKNKETAEAWNARFTSSMDEVVAANWNDKWSGNPLVMMVSA